MNKKPHSDCDPLLPMRELIRVSSLSRSTLHRAELAGRMPKSIQLTPGGRRGFRQSEVQAWLKDPLGWNGDPVPPSAIKPPDPAQQ